MSSHESVQAIAYLLLAYIIFPIVIVGVGMLIFGPFEELRIFYYSTYFPFVVVGGGLLICIIFGLEGFS